ncbi:MAG TPA: Gfo/Idh/MocA family oxidoreductase, partial [Propionibacteriaceae bacterium]|nr:Gfo/Idh/MocA family oxidoreductase [Propionibacteriaceae bacterium]
MSEPTGRKKLRVGIVGCGSIGNSHAVAYSDNPRAELVGVFDIIPERSQDYAERYQTTAYGSAGELLEQQPDLVSVATPPGTHTEVAVELLEGGSSVLLEKPPAINLADMDTLAAAD